MKVVCVDDSINSGPGDTFPNGPIVKGECYTVTGHGIGESGEKGYFLLEKPWFNHEKRSGIWHVKRFVPLTYYEAEFQVSEAVERTAQHEINATSGGEVGIAQIAE